MSNIVQQKKGVSENSEHVWVDPGEVFITIGAAAVLRRPDVDVALDRHIRGNWNDSADWSTQRKRELIRKKVGVISEHEDAGQTSFLILTEPGWPYTLILLPAELCSEVLTTRPYLQGSELN